MDSKLIFNQGNAPTGLGGNQALFHSRMQGGAHGYEFDGKSVAPGIVEYNRINTAAVTGGGRRQRKKSRKNRKTRKNRKSRRRY